MFGLSVRTEADNNPDLERSCYAGDCNQETGRALLQVSRRSSSSVVRHSRLPISLYGPSGVELRPEMFQGCKHIFIDVGSNRGVHVRKLFEPHLYPNSPYLELFDKGFGPPEQRSRSSAETGICAFGFEANPVWNATLQDLSDSYAKKGWRVRFFAPAFVSDHSGTTETIWINDGGQKSDWGASFFRFNDSAESLQVPSVDLARFMEMLNKHADSGYRLMKMDIEGAEFTVLPAFLQKKFLCKDSINVMTMEWHAQYRMKSAEEYNEAMKLMKDVNAVGKCSPSEDTQVLAFDDESYFNDDKPLPVTLKQMAMRKDAVMNEDNMAYSGQKSRPSQ
jgi:hypothetical protein